MDNSGYTPQTPPVQRHRRSERNQTQQAQTAQPAVRKPVQQPVQQTSSRAAWEQDDWQQGAHPGQQGYKPVQQARPAASQQPRPVQPKPVTPPVKQNTQSGYQNPSWQGQMRSQTDYRRPQQPYGYQENRPNGSAFAPSYGVNQNSQTNWNQGGHMYPPQDPAYVPQHGYQQQGTWQGNQGSGGGKPPKTRTILRNILLVALILAVLAGAGVTIAHTMEQKRIDDYVTSYNNVFCNGVYVDGIHLGGMTADEGIAAVQTQAQQRNAAWSVRLTYQGQLVTQITASDLNMRVDVMSVLNEAWQQGHVGDANTRKAAMDQLAQTPYQGYTAMPSSDTTVIDTTLNNIRNQVYRAPQDAQILSFDPEKTANPFAFQQEVPGRYLDTEPVKQQLYQMVSTMESGSIELTPVEIQPTVTVADLQKKVALRGTAYTKISTTSTEDRNKNIVRSCQLISGTIIQPGENFSFNNVVGKRSTENGFFTAVEYANGEHVEGIGGGVCQTSSTVYLAAIAAGMEIVHREPHSDAVGYTEYGKDATVYWEYGRKIDFVFRNNTESPIYMVAKVQSDPSNKKRLVCKVDIYGADMGNVTYSLETQTVEVLTPGPDIIVKDKKATYVTYTDEEYIQREAADGYVVESYRVKYENGNAVERTKLYTDTYDAKQKRIYVGVTTRPAS